jgi:hypothetical protein
MLVICCLNDNDECLIDYMDNISFDKLCKENSKNSGFQIYLTYNMSNYQEDEVDELVSEIIELLEKKYDIKPIQSKDNIFNIFRITTMIFYKGEWIFEEPDVDDENFDEDDILQIIYKYEIINTITKLSLKLLLEYDIDADEP